MNLKNLFILLLTLFVSLSLNSAVIAQKTKKVTTAKTTAGAKGNLVIEAGLVTRAGDVKPVARTQFYILDDDFETILGKTDIKPYMTVDTGKAGVFGSLEGLGAKAPKKAVSFVRSYAIWNSNPDSYSDNLLQVQEAIKPHTISTITTDFNGKGVFSQVKAGKYNLIGVYRVGRQTIVWSMSVEIKAANQTVILDNKNASEIF